MFLINNEFKVDAGPNGIQAYVTPNDYDLCPEESAYYPINAQVRAVMYSENWIQIYGKADVPKDIKVKQAEMFAHAIPYWQDYQQQLQYAREVEEASRIQSQYALQDAPFTGRIAGTPVALFPDTVAAVVTPTSHGPIGLPPLMDMTGQPIRHDISTPPPTPNRQQRIDKSRRTRSAKPMPWRRSTSCSDRRQRSATSFMTDPEPADHADYANTNMALRSRFTFGGAKQRPGSEIPKLPLDGLSGLPVMYGQDASSE